MKILLKTSLLAFCFVGFLGLTACSNVEKTANYPQRNSQNPSRVAPEGTLFGDDFLTFGTGGDAEEENSGGGGIGVNAFLWRASLDTVAFMPIASADPFGGVILTDWYSPPESAGAERVKLNIFILDRQLRADALRVALFRQEKQADGTWLDAVTAPETATELEDTILTRARQLRLSSNTSER